MNNKFHPCARNTFAVLFAVLVPAAVNAAQFEFKQDRPDAGTIVRRAIGSANIPLDKTYADLSPAAAQAVRESFPKLKPHDEPPFPEKSLRALIALATTLRYQTDGTARVSVVVQVDETGAARVVSAAESHDAQLFAGVVSTLAATRFRPGTCDGNPCSMEFPLIIEVEGIGRSIRQAQ